MRLLEDISATPLNPQVIIKEVQQVTNNVLGAPPPPPSNIAKAPLPKKRYGGALSNLKITVRYMTGFWIN